ncbi:MAG: hypothetical protein HYY06_07515 [Deltaproteobacteria bacterium]|nr:hypothetical protein [Deltaproteobacteria bacterium]
MAPVDRFIELVTVPEDLIEEIQPRVNPARPWDLDRQFDACVEIGGARRSMYSRGGRAMFAYRAILEERTSKSWRFLTLGAALLTPLKVRNRERVLRRVIRELGHKRHLVAAAIETVTKRYKRSEIDAWLRDDPLFLGSELTTHVIEGEFAALLVNVRDLLRHAKPRGHGLLVRSWT